MSRRRALSNCRCLYHEDFQPIYWRIARSQFLQENSSSKKELLSKLATNDIRIEVKIFQVAEPGCLYSMRNYHEISWFWYDLKIFWRFKCSVVKSFQVDFWEPKMYQSRVGKKISRKTPLRKILRSLFPIQKSSKFNFCISV